MNRYPVSEFLRHNIRWQEEYSRTASVKFADSRVVEIPPSDQSPMAQSLRIRYMMLKEGVEPINEAFYGTVFHLSWIFWVHHKQVLFDSGLIRSINGENAVLMEGLLRALHKFFHKDPVPHPNDVSINEVIATASEIDKRA